MKTTKILLPLLAAVLCFGSCKPDEPNATVKSITLNKEELLLSSGGSERLKATVKPEDAVNADVTWETSNENIARVAADGTVTAVAEGIAVITASAGGQEASCMVKVTPPRYMAGDYYPHPADASSAEGIVIWLDPEASDYNASNRSGCAGIMVSPGEGYECWGFTAYPNVVGAINYDDGMYNMEMVKTLTNWETQYPAFKWCDNLGEGWYLPAIHELQYLYCAYNGSTPVTWVPWYEDNNARGPARDDAARAAFDNKLTTAGGSSMSSDSYWSSTERSGSGTAEDGMALYLYFYGNPDDTYTGRTYWTDGDMSMPIRAVKKFATER